MSGGLSIDQWSLKMMMRKIPAIFLATGVLGLGQALAVTLIFLAILSAWVYLLNNSDRLDMISALHDPRSWLPILVVILGFIVYPIVMIAVGIKSIFQAYSIYRGKRKWISAASSLQVPILERSRVYDEYAEVKEKEWQCSLTIGLPVLAGNGIEERVIPVDVNERTYLRYRDKDSARIYYDMSDPLLFVFEGE